MKFLLFFISCFFSIISSFSQSVKKDSITDIQLKNAIDLYNSYTDGNAPVFNGSEYLYYTFKMEGNPFFQTTNFTRGWVAYGGSIYDSLSIIYDVNRNMLVVLNNNNVWRTILQNQFVDSFYLLGHTFITLNEDHKQNLYSSGFYDLLYNGRVQFLARRIKTIDAVIKDNSVVRIFYQKDRFYVHKDSLYYLVSNKKDVFRLFADKKSEIKKLMRHEHIKFRRKSLESALTKVTAFYDQLTH